jgi:hypothetical protein
VTGAYVTQKREVASPAIPKGRTGLAGQPGSDFTLPSLPAGKQETYSWRTNSRDVSEVEELAQDRRIFRNGFEAGDPRYDRGHEFRSTKRSIEIVAPEVYLPFNSFYDGQRYFYRGPLVPSSNRYAPSDIAGWLDAAQYSDPELVTLGQRAINNTAPTTPQAGAATFIGELFAGLPQMVGAALWKDKLTDYRAIGGEYLNVQFGWVPFLNDLRKVALSLKKASAILEQLQRDSGKHVRRRFSFPTELSNSLTELGGYGDNSYYGSPPFPVRSACQISRNDRTQRQVWFSGAYTYHLPVDENLLGKWAMYEAKANVLLGTRVTPEVVWNLAPWSWLVDWKFGIGNALSTASKLSSDGLVIQYGYLMEKTLREVTYSSSPWLFYGDEVTVPAAHITFRSESKKRVRATPYGFGVNPASLSDQQWAVLAALGLSRGPRTLG